VWTLGDHKLLVGDSLQADETKEFLAGLQVAMVATDPPYAIYGSSTGVSVEIADDKMVRPFFEAVMRLAHQVVPVFGHAYVCCDWRSWPALFDAARRSGMTAKNLLVWDKGGSGMGSNYANCYELLGFFAKIPTQGVMSHRKGGQRTVLRPNIVRIPRARGEDHQHNAAKPVPLMVEVITNSSERGDWVLDPFCGSGTTIVACENTGRRCAAVEIEPKWADVSVLRWQRVTGKKAVHGATGKAFGA
jgi:DNA modification methylase